MNTPREADLERGIPISPRPHHLRVREKWPMTDPSHNRGMVSRRSALVAGILGLTAFSGWGHLYVGRLDRLVAAIAAVGVLTLALGLAGAYSFFPAVVAATVAWIGLLPFTVLDPVWIALRSDGFTPKWYNRWWGYLATPAAMAVLLAIVSTIRGSVFGLDLITMRSAAMAPLIQEGEVVSTDRRAFERRSPAPGDIVVVRNAIDGRNLLRQVQSIAGRSITIGTPAGESQEISLGDLRGLVTFVLFSRDIERLGTVASGADGERGRHDLR